MDDKHKIAVLLRAFKAEDVDFDYAVKYILNIYTDSKRFNYHSFLLGIITGIIIYLICKQLNS